MDNYPTKKSFYILNPTEAVLESSYALTEFKRLHIGLNRNVYKVSILIIFHSQYLTAYAAENICREGGDIRLFITLVPKVSK